MFIKIITCVCVWSDRYPVVVSDGSKEREMKKSGLVSGQNAKQKLGKSEKDVKKKTKKDKNSKKDEEKKGVVKKKRSLKAELLAGNTEPKAKKSKIIKTAEKADGSNRKDSESGNNNKENAILQSKKTKTQKRNERKRQVLAKLKGKAVPGTNLDSIGKQADTSNNKEVVGDNVANTSKISSNIRHNISEREGLYVIDLEGKSGEAQKPSQIIAFSAAAAASSTLPKESSKRQKPVKASKKTAGKKALVQAKLVGLSAEKVLSLQGEEDNSAVESKHMTEQHSNPAAIDQIPSVELSSTVINSTQSSVLNPSNNNYIITRVDHLVGGKKRGDQSRVDLRFPIQNAYYQQQLGLGADQAQQSADLFGVENPPLAAEICSDSKIQQGKGAQLQEAKSTDDTLRDVTVDSSRDVDQYEDDVDQLPEIMSSKKPVETAIFHEKNTFCLDSPATKQPSDLESSQSSMPLSDDNSVKLNANQGNLFRTPANNLPSKILESAMFEANHERYEQMPSLLEFPKRGARIAFKTIEMDSSTGSAKVSKFQEGLVKSSNARSRQVLLEFFVLNLPSGAASGGSIEKSGLASTGAMTAPKPVRRLDFNMDIGSMDFSQLEFAAATSCPKSASKATAAPSTSLGKITTKLFDFDSLIDVKLVE
ncbi:hypothetical protein AYI70_g10709 [Smittium culicis]|uniref:Coilin tudor domain-containing protein n=1 Tax=Smittium culicis TaxID=133412 RepID=A0A1R1X5D8_9FUNG|nr:hypothetical protein AYI70_g10709 [Smittium culicis]